MYRFFLRSCKLLGAFIIAGIELGRARCRWRVTVPALSQGRPIRRAAALDLQEHTGHCAGSDPGQASRQSHQSGPDPSRSGLQPAGQPQNRGGRGPSGSRRAVPSHQHRREALFDWWLAGDLSRYQTERTDWQLLQCRPAMAHDETAAKCTRP